MRRNNWFDLLNKTIEADQVHTQEIAFQTVSFAFSTASSTNKKDKITYKTLPSWQKIKYDRLADEKLKTLYLETIREEREKNVCILKLYLIK